MSRFNGHGAYRSPCVPEGIDTKPTIEPFRERCPTCRKKFSFTTGYPRGRNSFLVIRMEGGPFDPMVMQPVDHAKRAEVGVDFAPPESRPHVARACSRCHTLRITEERPPPQSDLRPIAAAVAWVMFLAGVALGMFL